MVEERVSNDEVEDGSMYNTIDPNDDSDTYTDGDDGDDSRYERNPIDRQEKYLNKNGRQEIHSLPISSFCDV
jgi:hypothetical protein